METDISILHQKWFFRTCFKKRAYRCVSASLNEQISTKPFIFEYKQKWFFKVFTFLYVERSRNVQKSIKSVVFKYKLLCGLILLFASCEESKKLDKQAFFAQIASKEYIITEIEVPNEEKKVIDTFKKAYNAQKQLIVENDNIFFRYDSLTNNLREKIICLDEDCEKLLTWKYQYLNDKIFVQQFRNGELQQTQELSKFACKNISQVDTIYVFASQEDIWQADTLRKSLYEYYEKDKKNKSYIEQIYAYDSLGNVSEITRIFDKDSTNCIKIAFEYDTEGKKIKSLHSRPMPFEAKFSNYYTDHYKIYTYNTTGQLVEVKTYRNRKDTLIPFSITKYSYIRL